MTTTGLRLSPSERFLLRRHLIEDITDDGASPEALGACAYEIVATACVVVRHLQGRVTDCEALMSIESTRKKIEAARRAKG